MSIRAQGRITFVKIYDGATLNFVLSPNISINVIKSKDPISFNPTYSSTNLTLSPILTISGGGGANQVTAACRWYINGTHLSASTADYAIGTTSPFALTVKKNPDTPTTLIRAEYDYIGANGLSTTVSTSIQLTQVENAGTVIMAAIDPLDGDAFYTTAGATTSLRLQGRMVRGANNDTTDVNYAWAVLGTDGTYHTITAATAPANSGLPAGNLFSGYTTNILTFNSAAVLDIGIFRLTCTDTDSTSSTYNKTAVTYQSIKDMTDPYDVKIEGTNGTTFVSGKTSSLPALISVWQKGAAWVATAYDGKTLIFYRETSAGDRDATWIPSDKTGWTADSTNGGISRTFASGNGTDVNRTISIAIADINSTNTSFEGQLSF